MTDTQSLPLGDADTLPPTRTQAFEKRLARRYRAERNFKLLGIGAVVFSVAVLIFLIGTMLINGIPGLQRAELAVQIDFPQSGLKADRSELTAPSAMRMLEDRGLEEIVSRAAEQSLGKAGAQQVYSDAWRGVADALARDPSMLGRSQVLYLPASSDLTEGLNGEGTPEMRALAAQLESEDKLSRNWNWGFFTRSDATSPQMAGIWGALKGTMLTMLVLHPGLPDRHTRRALS